MLTISKRLYSTSVGFIGLGQMGHHMSRHLVRKGHKVVVCDVNAKAVNDIASEFKDQVTVAKSPKEVAKSANVVFTMLPATQHVEDVYLNDSYGLIKNGNSQSIFIDSSTIDPDAARKIHNAAKKANSYALDAPVSGGVMGAENATLTFMLGNKQEQEQNKIIVPILQKLGKNIVHCGESGNGLIAKICNNMLLAITMTGTSEALALGKALGMDPKLLSSIINTSTGRNWSCDTNNPVPDVMPKTPASRGYTGGFKTTLITKDLQLAMQCSYKASAPTYLGGVCHQLYNHLSRMDETKDKDFSVIFQFLDVKNKK